MIYVLYVIISANTGWTETSTSISNYPSEMACAEAAEKVRTANPIVITYCTRMQPGQQKTTNLEFR